MIANAGPLTDHCYTKVLTNLTKFLQETSTIPQNEVST
jgi:hypothetical protein